MSHSKYVKTGENQDVLISLIISRIYRATSATIPLPMNNTYINLLASAYVCTDLIKRWENWHEILKKPAYSHRYSFEWIPALHCAAVLIFWAWIKRLNIYTNFFVPAFSIAQIWAEQIRTNARMRELTQAHTQNR